MLLKVPIHDSIFLSFTTHPSQQSHLYYTHFVNVLLLDWSRYCSIDHSRSTSYPIKIFFQSLITKHFKRKSPLQPPCSYPMFEIFLGLSIIGNFKPRYQNESLSSILELQFSR
eukprot:TRINITY_DN2391_c3_g2_i1.p1 TRINITY_DN2391_c3_g2~~TRINITY_DN2391_c3_g2_i1.p1  ORF type:complete len:113 (+),score=10.64 TRINITY_DN2391_c3_g2_i1:23-361(+)